MKCTSNWYWPQGVRRGEACGLRWSDIDWRHRTIHVQRTVVKLSGQKIFTKEPKTASGNRRVYISKEMCKLLKAWKQECTWQMEQGEGQALTEEDYLFRQPSGDPMVPTTFTFRFKKILKENGAASKLICPQPAPYQRQPAHCSGRGCPHRGGASWSLPAKYHTGYLCPCL